MAGYLIEKTRRWPVISASARGQVLNKFRIWNERDAQMRKPYQSPGRMKNSSYYIAPARDGTHDLPYTVASNMVKVSHALNHPATAAVTLLPETFLSQITPIVSLNLFQDDNCQTLFLQSPSVPPSRYCFLKGALYRIWFGVNRLDDSGVKVVWIDLAILQLLLSRRVSYC